MNDPGGSFQQGGKEAIPSWLPRKCRDLEDVDLGRDMFRLVQVVQVEEVAHAEAETRDKLVVSAEDQVDAHGVQVLLGALVRVLVRAGVARPGPPSVPLSNELAETSKAASAPPDQRTLLSATEMRVHSVPPDRSAPGEYSHQMRSIGLPYLRHIPLRPDIRWR